MFPELMTRLAGAEHYGILSGDAGSGSPSPKPASPKQPKASTPKVSATATSTQETHPHHELAGHIHAHLVQQPKPVSLSSLRTHFGHTALDPVNPLSNLVHSAIAHLQETGRVQQHRRGRGEPHVEAAPSSLHPWQMGMQRFYDNYRQHADLQSQTPEEAQQRLKEIQEKGWLPPVATGVNVVTPTSAKAVIQTPLYKNPPPYGNSYYQTAQGKLTYAVPTAWVSPSHRIKAGWKPTEHEVVEPSRNGQPLHEAIVEKALRSGHPVPAHVLAEYPHLTPPNVSYAREGFTMMMQRLAGDTPEDFLSMMRRLGSGTGRQKPAGAPSQPPRPVAREDEIQNGATDGNDAIEMARWYCEMFNAHTQAGIPVTQAEMEQVDSELAETGIHLNYDEPSGQWRVILPSQQYGRELAEMYAHTFGNRAPAGGVTLTTKNGTFFFRGGEFIPVDAEHEQDASKHEAAKTARQGKMQERRQQQQTARRTMNTTPEGLRGKLATHKRELSSQEQKSATAALRSLKAFHGELTVHRLEELQQATAKGLERATKMAQKGNPKAAAQVEKFQGKLAALGHMLDQLHPEGQPAEPPPLSGSPAPVPWGSRRGTMTGGYGTLGSGLPPKGTLLPPQPEPTREEAQARSQSRHALEDKLREERRQGDRENIQRAAPPSESENTLTSSSGVSPSGDTGSAKPPQSGEVSPAHEDFQSLSSQLAAHESGGTGTTMPQLASLEQSIAHEPREKGYLIGKDGKVLAQLAQTGDATELVLSDDEERQAKDAVLTHNHPDGSAPSLGDFTQAIRLNMQQLRVVTPTGTHILTRPAGGWPRVDLGPTSDLLRQADRAAMAKVETERAAGGLQTNREARNRLREETAKNLAQRMGVDYQTVTATAAIPEAPQKQEILPESGKNIEETALGKTPQVGEVSAPAPKTADSESGESSALSPVMRDSELDAPFKKIMAGAEAHNARREAAAKKAAKKHYMDRFYSPPKKAREKEESPVHEGTNEAASIERKAMDPEFAAKAAHIHDVLRKMNPALVPPKEEAKPPETPQASPAEPSPKKGKQARRDESADKAANDWLAQHGVKDMPSAARRTEKPAKVKQSEVKEAERDWQSAMSQFGANNMATDRAEMRYQELKKQWESQKKGKQSYARETFPEMMQRLTEEENGHGRDFFLEDPR